MTCTPETSFFRFGGAQCLRQSLQMDRCYINHVAIFFLNLKAGLVQDA